MCQGFVHSHTSNDFVWRLFFVLVETKIYDFKFSQRFINFQCRTDLLHVIFRQPSAVEEELFATLAVFEEKFDREIRIVHLLFLSIFLFPKSEKVVTSSFNA